MSKYLNDAYTLRIPAELKARVAESAKTHNRSMNADIVARLEKSFEESQSSNTEIAELNERLAMMETAYHQTISHYDRILKLLEQQVDVKKLLMTKD